MNLQQKVEVLEKRLNELTSEKEDKVNELYLHNKRNIIFSLRSSLTGLLERVQYMLSTINGWEKNSDCGRNDRMINIGTINKEEYTNGDTAIEVSLNEEYQDYYFNKDNVVLVCENEPIYIFEPWILK